VSENGHVLAAHTRTDQRTWTRPRAVRGGPWSTTATPTLALDGQGRVRLLTVSASGDLVERHTASVTTDRWSRGDRMGMPGSWSTHTAPAATTDARGRLWVAAVSRAGALQTIHTEAQGRAWSRFRAVDRRTWSATSSPALTMADDGRLWLSSVTTRGGLYVRHTEAGGSTWHPARRVPGQWSPYSSPATMVDPRGRLWLAAVQTDGSVPVRWVDPGSVRWQTEGVGPGTSVTASPSFLPLRAGGVRVGSETATGQPVWARTGAPPVIAPLGTGAHPGGFAATLALILHL
jgi:hypothetical protein